MVADMRRVLDGDKVFDRVGASPTPEPLLSALSPQEKTLAFHLAQGLTNREIAQRMELAEKTVKNYVSNVLLKLGVTRRSAAAAYLFRIEAMMESSLVDDSRHDHLGKDPE